ncbi:hypothetical protein CC80DRAFT_542530 [Byssothecium circinans]|uniref:F-box domain-containing protein n=1 Tax=Byssothecium circinans TaxID=147558 RepID=A0A6A5UD32_9PLEO|nr:hypothetical protein CC80DRAFT_542530 [Byssothecium circinans]
MSTAQGTLAREHPVPANGRKKHELRRNVAATVSRQNYLSRAERARSLQDEQASYCEALKALYERRHALSNALPFSAHVVGQGQGFCYRQGVLCILEGSIIRVSDGRVSSEALEIELCSYISAAPEASSSSSSVTDEYSFTLLQYSDEIITVLCERKSRPNNGRILAISTKQEDCNRLIRKVALESSYKLFSRHTADWLYYGTYSAVSSNGHHEWEIQGVSLTTGRLISPFSLEGFFGTDIGSTIAFGIHEGFFYAVSNQTSFEVEEIDWTSFYHCISFPLSQPFGKNIEINKKVYRRQHKEGPIHDSWTELTLQFDDRTNKPIIVESRREWIGSSSKQLRTFYMTEFVSKATEPAEGSPRAELPENDILTSTLDSSSKPNFSRDEPRYNPSFHPEVQLGSRPARSFILARTKLKAYDLSSNTFVDLVEDDRCCPNSSTGPCLRLRVGSRRPAPLDWEPPSSSSPYSNRTYTPSIHPKDYQTGTGDTLYRHSAIRMWPPPADTCTCSKRLHNILNPALPSACGDGMSSMGTRSVTGILDDRALVYMLKSGRGYAGEEGGLGVVVMVRFDREITSGKAKDTIPLDGEGAKGGSELHWEWKPRACKSGTCY